MGNLIRFIIIIIMFGINVAIKCNNITYNNICSHCFNDCNVILNCMENININDYNISVINCDDNFNEYQLTWHAYGEVHKTTDKPKDKLGIFII